MNNPRLNYQVSQLSCACSPPPHTATDTQLQLHPVVLLKYGGDALIKVEIYLDANIGFLLDILSCCPVAA